MVRPLLVFLAIMFLGGCAGQTPMRIVDSALPQRISFEAEPIAVGEVTTTQQVRSGVIGNFHGGVANIPYSKYKGEILIGWDRKFRLMVYDELSNAGYRLSSEKHSLLSDGGASTPPGSVFEVAGSIQEVHYDTYSSVAGLFTEASVTVAWKLTDLRDGETAYDATREGAAEGPHEDIGVVVEAVRGSLRKVLADDSFVAAVE